MKGFLEAVVQAWNPVGAVRERLANGTLSVPHVLVSTVVAVAACQAFAFGAHIFFLETLAKAGAGLPPQLAAMKNPVVQGVLSALGLLIPVGAVYLLPTALFKPYLKGQIAAVILLVAAAWSVYGASISAPGYVLAGLVASADVQTGVGIYAVVGVLGALLVLVITLVVWLKVSRSVLGLNFLQVCLFLLVPVVCAALLSWGLIVLIGIPGVRAP